MAIDEDTGIEVSVRVDGADLLEYESPDAAANDDAHPVITKYIECLDDAIFAIRIVADIPYDWGKGWLNEPALYVRLALDGQTVARRLASRDYPSAMVTGAETLDSDGQWVERKFQFTSISTIEEPLQERVEKDKAVAETRGKIEVRFERGYIGGPAGTASDHTIKTMDMVLAEKSLKGKGISHGTAYGEATAVPVRKRCQYELLGNDPDPIPIFRFLYRSKEALKNELIIPRSPPTLSPILDTKSENGKSSVKRDFGTFYDLTQDSSCEKPSKLVRKASDGKVNFIDLTAD